MLTALFERPQIGKVLLNLRRRIVSVNTAYAQLLGYTPGALVGQCIDDLLHPDDLTADQIQFTSLIFCEQPSTGGRKRYYAIDGRIILVEWTATRIMHEGQVFCLYEINVITSSSYST